MSLNTWKKLYLMSGLLLFWAIPLSDLSAQGTYFNQGFTDAQNNSAVSSLPRTSAVEFIANVITWLLGLVGLLAVLAMVWGGVRLMTGTGSDDQVAGAKKIIQWAIVGLIIVIFAWNIIEIVINELIR